MKLSLKPKYLTQIKNFGPRNPMGLIFYVTLDMKNSFSEPRAELQTRMQKWFAKHPSLKFCNSLPCLQDCRGADRRRKSPLNNHNLSHKTLSLS